MIIQGGNVIEGSIERGQLVRPAGLELYVDSVHGSNNNSGLAWDQAKATLAAAIGVLEDAETLGNQSTIFAVGDFREQIVAPLSLYGVRIVGVAVGNNRHDNGLRWRDPASPVAGKALIEILEQGWEFQKVLFVANATGSAIKAHRNEDATYPDSSHFIVDDCKFAGGLNGIEDVGGNHHYRIRRSEFTDLTGTGILCASTGIAIPLRNLIEECLFVGNAHDIRSSLSRSVIRRNHFLTPGTSNTIINTKYNSGQGAENHVVLNVFNNTEAQIAPATGYTGCADDVRANYVNDQAALAVGLPA